MEKINGAQLWKQKSELQNFVLEGHPKEPSLIWEANQR